MLGTLELGSLLLGGSEEETGGSLPINSALETKGNGLVLTWGSGEGSTVLQVMSYQPPEGSSNKEDTTCFGETTVTHSVGIPDWSDAQIEVKYALEAHAGLLADFKSGERKTVVATYSDGSTETYEAQIGSWGVTQFEPKTPAIKQKLSFVVTGDVDYAEGA